MPKYPLYLLLLLFLSAISCEDRSVHYSTNPNDLLSFSNDTVSFDTILSTVNTPKKSLMIYNLNKSPLLISSIRLEKGDNSEFKINVDGMAGDHFENVEIGANDSLFVLIDAKPAENGQTTPILKEDKIIFTTNNTQQKIVLKAYSQDVHIWKGVVLDTSLILPNDKPYLIYDSLEIKENAVLTIQEGTTFYLHSSSRIQVKGSIKATGTKEKRIVFRGDRMDYLANVSYDWVPGQWGGIVFSASSFNNEMDYVYIRNSIFGLLFESSDPASSKLKIRNSIVSNAAGPLITATNCQIEGANCEFSNAKNYLMSLTGGTYTFTHCTMANYFTGHPLWGSAQGKTLVLSNLFYEKDQPKAAPLLQADFSNSVIWGLGLSPAIELARDSVKFPSTAFNYKFQNCLVPNKDSTNTHFVKCIFGKDPKFFPHTDEELKDQLFVTDFRLDSISPARNVADPVIAAKYPFDMNGISRFSDQGPDMGAYEWVKDEETKATKK